MKTPIDPITLEVMRNGFQSVAEEMGAALIRAALSTNIKDRRDCSTAIYTAQGDLVAQAEHIPLHLGLMVSVVKKTLERFPPEQLLPGDAIITNDPYISGSHLPDICMITPVFSEGRCLALLANLAHHVDVGGMTPGSMPTTATEIFQEGLRIPPVKIKKEGRVDESLLALITNNVRTGYEAKGDFQAQFAANTVGERRLQEMLGKYGPEMMTAYMEAIIDYAERRMRHHIRELPEGTFCFEDFLEGDGISTQPIKIQAALTSRDDSILVDFTGTDPQAEGSVNATRAVTLAAVYFALKAVIDPDLPSSEGACRPIDVITPIGSLVNPRFPAPVSNANINTAQRIADVVLGALAQAVPERVPAASTGSMSNFTIGGVDPGTGQYYSYVETYGGGHGALREQDGMDGVHTNMTNTRNAPVEVIENAYPLRVGRYGLVPDSEGPGRARGGMGMTREIIIVDHQAHISLGTERRDLHPWGLMGGESAGGSDCRLVSAEGENQPLPAKVTMTVPSGTCIVLETAGGGGYGPALERDPEKVLEDVLDGLISFERARTCYGVVIDPETGRIDRSATRRQREERQGES